MLAQRGISSPKCTPGSFVGMLRNGPAVGRPGFGSHVSNWLGAPQSQSRMQHFCVRFACCAKAGSENKPPQLINERAPAPATPWRNLRRCTV
jgi:hypothetical protein